MRTRLIQRLCLTRLTKNKSTASWRDITLKHLDTPTVIKAYIQHVFKENSKIWENNSNRFTQIIQENSKDVSKEPEFLYKAPYKVYLYKREAPGQYKV
jgi:hypothetical protein